MSDLRNLGKAPEDREVTAGAEGGGENVLPLQGQELQRL